MLSIGRFGQRDEERRLKSLKIYFLRDLRCKNDVALTLNRFVKCQHNIAYCFTDLSGSFLLCSIG